MEAHSSNINNNSSQTSSRLRNRKQINYCENSNNVEDNVFPNNNNHNHVIEFHLIENPSKNKSHSLNTKHYYKEEDEEYNEDEDDDEDEDESFKINAPKRIHSKKKKRKLKTKKLKKRIKVFTHSKTRKERNRKLSQTNYNTNDDYSSEYLEITPFETSIEETKATIKKAEELIKTLEKQYIEKELSNVHHKSIYPDLCIPINTNILKFGFDVLISKQLELTNRLFDVILMDPPWKLSSSHPTRGVAIAYDQLNDNVIENLPIPKLQTDGFIFIWTINAKYHFALDLLHKWGYKYCDEIIWVKQTVKGKTAKGHGFYLQHTKETCLVGIKGNPTYDNTVTSNSDVIFSLRRGQSQKPTEIYERIEKMVPNGYYLELFGRRNNLREYWVTIGNEI
jgi:mRNA (2'-O-methyladenosine-N6-)-methyltransferase